MTAKTSATDLLGAERSQVDRRLRLRTGLLHGYGAAILAFGPSIVDDVVSMTGARDFLFLSLTGVTACLAACGWMVSCAWRHPLRETSSWPETWSYLALALAVTGSFAIEVWVHEGATFEVVRSVVSLALVVRLVAARGTSVRELVRGELRRPRGEEASDLPWKPLDRWLNSFTVIMIGIALSAAAEYLLTTVPGLVHGTSTVPGSLVDWVDALRSGPVEEMVAVAGLVLALEYAGRPAWMVYASTIALRISFHLWIGVPACLVVVPLATAATWAYRRWRAPSGLVFGHTLWDVGVTLVYVL